MKLNEVNKVLEGRMPSSVIKSKERLTQMAYDDPEALKSRFEEIAARPMNDGKSARDIALETQWRHGYGKDNQRGHYVKIFSEK